MKKEKIYSQYMYSFPHKKAYSEISKEVIEKIFLKTKGDIGVYLHIPFCSSKCGYCNLFSIVKKDNEYIDKYVEQVLKEIDYVQKKIDLENINLTSFVIGGGTPLVLSILQMEKIFNKIEEVFSVDLNTIEFQMETSPNETSLDKLVFLKKRGLKRLSIGIQSFIEEELKSIYRQHSVKASLDALDHIKNVDFIKKNLDIIYGIPKQNEESLLYSLKKAIEYDFEEIFLYPLYVRKNTILGKLNTLVDEELQYNLYCKSVDFLEKNGYIQISMRRFVKNKDNIKGSCGFEKSISFGCGGRSYLENIHFCEEYSSNTNKCFSIIDKYLEKEDFFKGLKGFILNEKLLKIRFLIKNLGQVSGVNKNEYINLFKNDIFQEFPQIKEFLKNKLIIEEDNILKLSKEGLGYSDYILYSFIPENMKDNFYE